jgi:hypothetical protein
VLPVAWAVAAAARIVAFVGVRWFGHSENQRSSTSRVTLSLRREYEARRQPVGVVADDRLAESDELADPVVDE